MHLSSIELLKWVIRRPLVVILITALITFFFAWQIRNLSFKTSIYDLQIENLPETARYEKFKYLFGSDEIIRIVVHGQNVFDPVTFHKIEQLAEATAQIRGVKTRYQSPGYQKGV